MELYQLKYFEEVARYESVSKAAEKLHISQPALSKAIAKLESDLGVELFDRVGKRISLNESGAVFRESVSQLLMHANESVNSIRQFNEAYGESVNIAVRGPQKEALACTVAFMQANPEVRINFDVKRSQEKKGALFASDVVFAPVGTPFSPSVGIPYATRKLDLAVSWDSPFAQRSSVALEELKDEHFIMLTSPYELYELSYGLCTDCGFVPIVRVTTGSKPALLEFVRRGMGIGLLDGYAAGNNVEGVSIVALENTAPIRSLCFACRDPETLTPAAKRYVEFMFDYFDIPISKLELAVFDRK